MKMKILKKALVVFMICGCAAVFSACGSADSSSGSKVAASALSQQEQTTESKADEGSPAESKPSEDKSSPSDVSSKTETTDTPAGSGKDTLVIYFSATGTTKGVAERIAKVTDADVFELIPAEPYSDADLDWHDDKSRTTIEMNDPDCRPAIANDTVSFEGYKTVYIGYPIWWGDAPRMMSTFVEAHNLDGLTVIPFCTSGSSSIGRSGENLASQAGSGNWLKGDRFEGGISEDEIQSWINGLS